MQTSNKINFNLNNIVYLDQRHSTDTFWWKADVIYNCNSIDMHILPLYIIWQYLINHQSIFWSMHNSIIDVCKISKTEATNFVKAIDSLINLFRCISIYLLSMKRCLVQKHLKKIAHVSCHNIPDTPPWLVDQKTLEVIFQPKQSIPVRLKTA